VSTDVGAWLFGRLARPAPPGYVLAFAVGVLHTAAFLRLGPYHRLTSALSSLHLRCVCAFDRADDDRLAPA
jgi:hypothetical protein